MSDAKQYRPGPGWRQCKCPAVLEHPSGVVAHVGGMARLQDGMVIYGQPWPESRELDRFVRINGGNRRRGVLAWALSKAKGGGE